MRAGEVKEKDIEENKQTIQQTQLTSAVSISGGKGLDSATSSAHRVQGAVS